jgi:hypothetical protein
VDKGGGGVVLGEGDGDGEGEAEEADRQTLSQRIIAQRLEAARSLGKKKMQKMEEWPSAVAAAGER